MTNTPQIEKHLLGLRQGQAMLVSDRLNQRLFVIQRAEFYVQAKKIN